MGVWCYYYHITCSVNTYPHPGNGFKGRPQANKFFNKRCREFFKALGLSKQQFDRTPDFMVKTEKDKIRLMLRSTIEPGITFGEWVTITISPREFLQMTQHFQSVVEDATKRT